MWWSALIRFIRRRIVLGFIFSISLLYYLCSHIDKADFLSSGDEGVEVRRTQPFIWRTLQQHNTSGDLPETCRNSVQGKVLIVDDRGYVCPRKEVLPTGCCNDTPSGPPQYTCDTCSPSNCCAIYEYCISCCLHPDKRDMLEQLLGKAAKENNVLFASVTDHFELCLAKCRTNSQSVQHENSYKDPKLKHCYGESPPGAASHRTDNEVF